MELDLKQLRAHPGQRQPFFFESEFNAEDFAEPVVLNGPLTAEGWVVVHRNDVVDVHIDLRIQLERACSRCLASIPLQIALEEDVFVVGTVSPQLLPESFNYVRGDKALSLMPICLSLVLGQFDSKPLCRPNCRGLCPGCGVDRNLEACHCERQGARDPRLTGLSQLLEET